jgi:hypothetical protein
MSDGGSEPENGRSRSPHAEKKPAALRPDAQQRPAAQRPAADGGDPSVFAEPWLVASVPQAGPMDRSDEGRQQAELAEHSVWDELSTDRSLSGEPAADAVTWYRHYLDRVERVSGWRSWLVTAVVALVAGPAAILATLWGGAQSGIAWVAIVILGPTMEEVMKIALPLWLVERRPWLFRSFSQILVCGLMSGLAFAAVENAIYLNLYVPNPTPALVQWRWTVCVALHTTCSAVAAVGVARVWSRMRQHERRPQLTDGTGWLIAAVALHSLYNATAILIDGWFE